MAYPHLVRDARFIELMGDTALARTLRRKGTGLRTELAAMKPDERIDRVRQELTDKLARILDASPDKLDVSTSLDSLRPGFADAHRSEDFDHALA